MKQLEITKTCVKCDECRLICPENSILVSSQTFVIDNWSCSLCNICVEICPSESIKEVLPNQNK